MHIREGTYDKEIIKEIAPTYGWMNVKNKTVLDIGGCFGAAAVFFAENEARKVISIEPEKENFNLLKKNTKNFKNIEAIKAAVVENKNLQSVELYKNDGVNKGIHSLVVTRGRKITENVPTVQFSELLKKYKPAIIKLDVEGFEYEILKNPLPNFVKQITIEIHFGKRVNREILAPKLVALFKSWKTVRKPKLDGNNWTTIGAWER